MDETEARVLLSPWLWEATKPYLSVPLLTHTQEHIRLPAPGGTQGKMRFQLVPVLRPSDPARHLWGKWDATWSPEKTITAEGLCPF